MPNDSSRGGEDDDDERRFGIEPHNLQCMGNIKYDSSP
jgi:hypothetical protein